MFFNALFFRIKNKFLTLQIKRHFKNICKPNVLIFFAI